MPWTRRIHPRQDPEHPRACPSRGRAVARLSSPSRTSLARTQNCRRFHANQEIRRRRTPREPRDPPPQLRKEEEQEEGEIELAVANLPGADPDLLPPGLHANQEAGTPANQEVGETSTNEEEDEEEEAAAAAATSFLGPFNFWFFFFC